MSATTNGVYLVTDSDEFFLGRTYDILQGTSNWGQGISLSVLIMDIVQAITSDPKENSQTITIEIRD